MFTGSEIVDTLRQIQATHVVTLPDSTIGPWQESIAKAGAPRLIRVCREGEAWAIAAGLWLGGARPIVMIQCTGLFESGDSLRNAIHDYKIPLFALIGYRSYLSQKDIPGDSARIYTEPILKAWGLETVLIERPNQRPLIAEHFERCLRADKAGVALIAEGRG